MSRQEQLLISLGKGSGEAEIISSAVLAVLTFFYAYTISSFLALEVFVLKDRVVYDNPFEQHLIGNYADNLIISLGALIWLYISFRRPKIRNIICIIYAGLLLAAIAADPLFIEVIGLIVFPIVAVLASYHALVLTHRRKELVIVNSSLYLNYFSSIVVIISMISILVTLGGLISPQLGNSLGRNYSYEIFVMISPASAVLMALLAFSLPLKIILGEILALFPRLRVFSPYVSEVQRDSVSSSDLNVRVAEKSNSRVRSRTLLVLMLILALSVGLALIPYQSAFNEDDRLVGVDTAQYTIWLENLLESSNKDLDEFLADLFIVQGTNGDRPLSLLFMFLAVKILSPEDISQTLDQSSLVLAPLLVLSVYFLTFRLTSNSLTSIVAAFLTAISSQVLVGIFAGFYANWIALILGYFCLGYLFKFLMDPTRSTLVIFSGLLIGTLFAHVYTWTIISLCASVFLVLLLVLRRREYSRKAIGLILIVITTSAVIDILKSLGTDSTSGILRDFELSGEGMGQDEFAQRWATLTFTLNSGLAGILGNSIIILLGLYWVLKSNIREPTTLFLLIFLSVAIVPLFLGDWIIQSRTLYMIPFQIFAAMGLGYMLDYNHRSRGYLHKITRPRITGVFGVVAICGLLAAAAVTVLSNLYLVLPHPPAGF